MASKATTTKSASSVQDVKSAAPAPDAAKRAHVSQTEFPNLSLEQSLRIARAIWDNFAGKSAAPHQIAIALDLSPTSGGWRNLCGASIAYGLTEGGYNATLITLTELGRQIVAPTAEGEDGKALQRAVLAPRIPGEFFRQYDRAKFPRDDIAANILVTKGLPKERAAQLVDILKQNGVFVGFIQETKTGPFVSIDAQPTPQTGFSAPLLEPEEDLDHGANSFGLPENPPRESAGQRPLPPAPDSNRVFITHGKNREILNQIKEVVELGGFVPVVSIQNETAAKPIPDKVMDDMRNCSAAVIHVGAEGVLQDKDGKDHTQINPNVLIEIGAAMALYRGRFILVVENGVELPSNLQGLYQSRYSGSAIEFQAGMNILKALRGLRAS
jgi:hypothetical protein